MNADDKAELKEALRMLNSNGHSLMWRVKRKDGRWVYKVAIDRRDHKSLTFDEIRDLGRSGAA